MGILFVVALLLAWPTYGLSILVWLGLMFFKAKKKVNEIDRRKEMAVVLEPLFNDRFDDFFLALDIPYVHGYHITREEAKQCGRHVMNYIAHHPSETAIFMKGLEKWRVRINSSSLDPIEAAQAEMNLDEHAEMHYIAYRAVETIMKNNPNLKCFHKVDLAAVYEYGSAMDLALLLGRQERA